jgi:uncharacterized protein YndB with AHSA1/START domain
MVPEQVEREVVIDAPVEVVWETITQAEHVSRWFGDSATVDLRPGGLMLLIWERYGTLHARIETVEPPYRFSFRWATPEVEPREGNSTLVEFTLSPRGERTHLRVRESGFPQLEGTEADRQRHVSHSEEGWNTELGELVDYVARQAAAARR